MVLIYTYRKQKTYPGFKLFIISILLSGLGSYLISLRHLIPAFLSVVLSNSFIITSQILFLWSVHNFCNIRKNLKADILLIALFILCFYFFTYIKENISIRIIIISAFDVLISLRIFTASFKDVKKIFSNIFLPLTASALLMAIISLFRLSFYSLNYKYESDFMSSDIINSTVYLIHASLIFFRHLSFIMLNNYRSYKDLEESKKEIFKLQKLLPMCSHCHKIRDDKGYWEKLELYLIKNSDILISHGICPDCLEKYYPQLKKNYLSGDSENRDTDSSDNEITF